MIRKFDLKLKKYIITACLVAVLSIFISFIYREIVGVSREKITENSKSVIAEVVVVSHKDTLWYCYAKGQENLRDGITILSEDAAEGCGALEVGQKVRISFDGFLELLDPPSFTVVYSIEVIGKATEKELQDGMNLLTKK